MAVVPTNFASNLGPLRRPLVLLGRRVHRLLSRGHHVRLPVLFLRVLVVAIWANAKSAGNRVIRPPSVLSILLRRGNNVLLRRPRFLLPLTLSRTHRQLPSTTTGYSTRVPRTM